MHTSPELSIIIVNWNSVHFLEKCLRSIYENNPDLKFEIIVVDNASYDGSQEMLGAEFPHITFIQNSINEGFARANNLAFQRSKAPLILFLNPDTEVIGQSLSAMVHFMDTTPDAGIVGPQLLNSDLSVQTASIMRFPSILDEAFNVDYLHLTFPDCPLWNIAPLLEHASSGTAVEAIPGAAMMVRRNVFEQVGLFDTDYFMFSEDLDLCYKVRQAGWRTYYYGLATVIHHGGGSTASAPDGFRYVMIQAAHAEFLRKRRGRLAAFLYKRAMSLISALRIVVVGALLLSTLGLLQRQNFSSTLSKWWAVLMWSIGTKRIDNTPTSTGSRERSPRRGHTTSISDAGSFPRGMSQGRKTDLDTNT